MQQTDKTKPVMVTGATGYVAGWVIKKLLDEGYTVHAAVRNPDNKEKIAHLVVLAENAPGNIQFFKSDLLNIGSYAEAMAGCETVFHTASPFTSDFKDAQKELIDPAVKGTANVLEQANKTPSVKRVVLTSSCAAIYADCSDLKATPKGVFTEEVWNKTASLKYQPYGYSKTLAEQEAWKIADAQEQWELVVMNPSFVLGPSLNPTTSTSESMSLLKQMGDGSFKSGAPNLGIGVVDVRDLAQAHYNAAFMPTAQGRNIISGHNSSFLELVQILHKQFGKTHKIPNKAVPKWLLMLVGPFINKTLTRRYLRNNLNLEWKADNSKSKKELGMSYRPLEETMVDGFQALIDAKIL
jgi:nucleoside-diphosphate-sugar epimerase